jgi:hypothetical protein
MGNNAVILGGNWDNGANCGSRASNWNNSPSNSNNNIGCRGVCDDKEVGFTWARPVLRYAYGLASRPSNLWSAVLSCFGKYIVGSGIASSSLWKHMANDAASVSYA